MDLISDNYYVLTIVPISILIVSSLIGYKLGLRIPSSIGIGLILSLITIIILHRFHFKDNKLINETGNLYVSIYITTDIILLITISCYYITRNPHGNCCCKCCKEKGPEHLYSGTDGIERDDTEGGITSISDQNSVDVHGYNNPALEHYQDDMLGYTSEEVHPGIIYETSGFVGSFKNKGDIGSRQFKDDEWNKETIVIPIDDNIPEVEEKDDINTDDGLIYEYIPPKIFDNSDSE